MTVFDTPKSKRIVFTPYIIFLFLLHICPLCFMLRLNNR